MENYAGAVKKKGFIINHTLQYIRDHEMISTKKIILYLCHAADGGDSIKGAVS